MKVFCVTYQYMNFSPSICVLPPQSDCFSYSSRTYSPWTHRTLIQSCVCNGITIYSTSSAAPTSHPIFTKFVLLVLLSMLTMINLLKYSPIIHFALLSNEMSGLSLTLQVPIPELDTLVGIRLILTYSLMCQIGQLHGDTVTRRYGWPHSLLQTIKKEKVYASDSQWQ